MASKLSSPPAPSVSTGVDPFGSPPIAMTYGPSGDVDSMEIDDGERPKSSDAYSDAEIIANGGYVEDDWRLPKHNPLGRLAFGPPPGHQLEVLPFLQAVALRYKSDLKRLFRAYTHINGHKTRHVSKLTFDDEQRETDRLSLDGLFNMLKDFDLISKQNSRTMEFYTPTALRWIRLGCLPALCKHGTLPVSKEEVNVVVRRWQRRKERNGLREDQLRLEDMDMEGFVRCFARICILGFRRLEATPSNMERNSWSTDAIEAFREASAPPPNKRKGRSWDENRDVGFRTIVGTQASIWLRTLAARRRRRPIDNVPLLRTDRRYVVTAKILEAYNAPSHLDYLTMEAAMSTNTYRDTNHLVRDLTQRDDEIHRLFDELDTGKSGSVHKKDLLKAIQSDGVAKRMIETSPALAPLLHPQTYKDAFDDIDTKRVTPLRFRNSIGTFNRSSKKMPRTCWT